MAEERQPFYRLILVTEDKITQIYLEDYSLKIYIPFISHFCMDPGLMAHYQTTNTSILEQIGDFGRIVLQEEDEDPLKDNMTD